MLALITNIHTIIYMQTHLEHFLKCSLQKAMISLHFSVIHIITLELTIVLGTVR